MARAGCRGGDASREGSVGASHSIEQVTKPGFIPPMLATLVGAPFDDPDWLFEVKWDGFRVEVVVDGDTVRLWTRGEQDHTPDHVRVFKRKLLRDHPAE